VVEDVEAPVVVALATDVVVLVVVVVVWLVVAVGGVVVLAVGVVIVVVVVVGVGLLVVDVFERRVVVVGRVVLVVGTGRTAGPDEVADVVGSVGIDGGPSELLNAPLMYAINSATTATTAMPTTARSGPATPRR
jgi:hypothetical protein